MNKINVVLIIPIFFIILLSSVANAESCRKPSCIMVKNKSGHDMYVYPIGVKTKSCNTKPRVSKKQFPNNGIVKIFPNIDFDGCSSEFVFANTKVLPKKNKNEYFNLDYQLDADTLEVSVIPTVFNKNITLDLFEDPITILPKKTKR